MIQPTKSAYFSGDEEHTIYYSYGTCGNPDTFIDSDCGNLDTFVDSNCSSIQVSIDVSDDGWDSSSIWYLVSGFLVLLISVVTAGWWYFQRYKRKNRPIGPDLEAEVQKLQHERASIDDGVCFHEVRVPIELPLRTINVMDEIGKGTFGVVSKALYTPNTVSLGGTEDQTSRSR